MASKTIQDNMNALTTDVCALTFDYKVSGIDATFLQMAGMSGHSLSLGGSFSAEHIYTG